MWFRHGSWLLLTGMLGGCAMVNGSPPPSSAPIFQADVNDTVLVQAVQREHDILLRTCGERQSCDQVHFTRAMIALFQNGEVATASFQQAIAVAPNGPFADSSARWVRFLTNWTSHPTPADEPNGPFAVVKGLVRTWLGQQRTASAAATLPAVATANNPKLAVHTLQRQIRDRDKRIAELTDQLSTLKQIDSDVRRLNKLNLPRAPSK